MRRLIFLFVLFFLVAGSAFGQDCTQKLRLARAIYEQGRLHELGPLLEGCLSVKVGPDTRGFLTVQEKVDAYRLLCLAYIYLENPVEADKAMLGILNTDHFFTLNPTDPAEFQALYKTFRSEPIFSYGFKVGANYTMPNILANHYVLSESPGNGKYIPGINFSVGGFLDKEFFTKLDDDNFLKWTSLRFESFFNIRAFKISYPEVAVFKVDPGDGTIAAAVEGKSSSGWLDFNLIARYRLNHDGAWDPYVGIGPGLSILLNSKINQAKIERKKITIEESGIIVSTSDSYSGPSVDVLPAFNLLAKSATVVLGVNRRFGAFYINGEIRYQHGFGNLINPSKRTIKNFAPVYGITLNDFSQNNLLLSIGVTIPQFSPKKLSKRK